MTNYDRVTYNWNGIRIEVIIPECPELGVAMDLSDIELKKVGIEMPTFLGRVEWNEFLYKEDS